MSVVQLEEIVIFSLEQIVCVQIKAVDGELGIEKSNLSNGGVIG